uniref:Jacalin-type lectin domain-containing protein n=1 Tax=Musa acuminata subsp. malaccensis TaxID=214687 RepID=A0A804KUH5_MUSAM
MGKVVKEGPWGANAGNAFDTGRVDRFTKVKIYHGDVIYGLELTFVVGGKPQPPMLIGTKKRASQELGQPTVAVGAIAVYCSLADS